MRTIAEPVAGSEVRVAPRDQDGVVVNGTPATLEHVCKEDVRVDLGPRGARSFVVEHVVGVLGLHGVTAAEVSGIRETWDFARPEHRHCWSVNLGPEQVVGHPAGLPNPDLSAALAGVEKRGRRTTRTTVTEPVSLEAGGGRIELRPREYGAGIRFEAAYGGVEFVAEVDPAGDNDPGMVEAVVASQTPFLSESAEEGVTHSIVDLTSDVAVIGGFDDLVVEADLGDAYHQLTVGVARKAREAGVVEVVDG